MQTRRIKVCWVSWLCLLLHISPYSWQLRANIAETNLLVVRAQLETCLRHTQELEEELIYTLAADPTQSIFDVQDMRRSVDDVAMSPTTDELEQQTEQATG